MAKRPFKLKVFTSFLLTVAFFASLYSGLALYLAPKGRIANWIHWTFTGLDKETWGSVHIVFVTVMLITALLHLFWFNWKVFWSYFVLGAKKGLRYPLELGLTLLLGVLFWLGAVYEVQPVISVVRLSESIDASYERRQKNEPPIPHAEDMTLSEVAEKILDKPVEEVVTSLHAMGFTEARGMETLATIAARYNTSPNAMLDSLRSERVSPAETEHVPGSGAGWGRKTVAAVAGELGMSTETALQKLAAAGIETENGASSLKDLANAHNMTPMDLVNILRPD